MIIITQQSTDNGIKIRLNASVNTSLWTFKQFFTVEHTDTVRVRVRVVVCYKLHMNHESGPDNKQTGFPTCWT